MVVVMMMAIVIRRQRERRKQANTNDTGDNEPESIRSAGAPSSGQGYSADPEKAAKYENLFPLRQRQEKPAREVQPRHRRLPDAQTRTDT